MKEKVVLAYSGGLDTTAIIPWLKETFDYEVICCCIDCGQGNELVGLDERAKLSGASKLYIENVIDEFSEDFIMPCVKAVRDQRKAGQAQMALALKEREEHLAQLIDAILFCGHGNHPPENTREALNQSSRADSWRFCLRRKFGKRRNTGCISRFPNCTDGAKDSLLSRRRFVQRFPRNKKQTPPPDIGARLLAVPP